MLDHMQVTIGIPPLLQEALPALLKQPDFRDGLEDGHVAYHECVEEDDTTPWTEENLIAFVERNLSGNVYHREKRIAHCLHYEVTPYFYSLGFVVSWIDEIMTR